MRWLLGDVAQEYHRAPVVPRFAHGLTKINIASTRLRRLFSCEDSDSLVPDIPSGKKVVHELLLARKRVEAHPPDRLAAAHSD